MTQYKPDSFKNLILGTERGQLKPARSTSSLRGTKAFCLAHVLYLTVIPAVNPVNHSTLMECWHTGGLYCYLGKKKKKHPPQTLQKRSAISSPSCMYVNRQCAFSSCTSCSRFKGAACMNMPQFKHSKQVGCMATFRGETWKCRVKLSLKTQCCNYRKKRFKCDCIPLLSCLSSTSVRWWHWSLAKGFSHL